MSSGPEGVGNNGGAGKVPAVAQDVPGTTEVKDGKVSPTPHSPTRLDRFHGIKASPVLDNPPPSSPIPHTALGRLDEYLAKLAKPKYPPRQEIPDSALFPKTVTPRIRAVPAAKSEIIPNNDGTPHTIDDVASRAQEFINAYFPEEPPSSVPEFVRKLQEVLATRSISQEESARVRGFVERLQTTR